MLGREREGKRIGIRSRSNSLSERKRSTNGLIIERNTRSRIWACAGAVEAQM